MFGKTTTVLFWACALICFVAFHSGLRLRMDKLKPVGFAERMLERAQPWVIAAALALTAGLGLFARLYQFPALPGGVNQDAALAASDAAALARYGADRLGTPWPAHMEAWGHGQMSALLTYILAGMFKVFGMSKLALRLPQMVISLLSIAVFWDFARRTLGKSFGWLALALLLINPWHIMQSRWTIDCALFPHFFLFGAYCLLRGMERRAWYYAGMVLFALSMYTYGIALYTVPPFLLAALIVMLCQKLVRPLDAALCGLLYLLLSLPFLAVMILNAVGGETFTLFGFTIQRFEDSIRAAEIVLMQPDKYAGFVANAAYMFNVLLFQRDNYPYMNLLEYGSNYLFAMPLILTGVAAFVGDRISKRQPWLDAKRRRARWGMLLTVLWLLAAIWSALNTSEVHLGRAAILIYPVILMIAYAIWLVGKRRRLLALLLAAVFALGAVRFTGDYFSQNTQKKLGRYYYAGLIEAMEATRGRSMDTLYITLTFPDETPYGMPLEVLVEYAARLDAQYVHQGAPASDADGRVWLPFAERYQRAEMDKLRVDPRAEALYIIFEPDKEYFDPDTFVFEPFGDYYLVTPNVLME